jgi:type IV pilus assembly protein PilW
MCAASEASKPARPARGVSLVELMVGLVICLLIGLAASKSAQVFNAIQRQGVATGTGSSNALSALSAIKEDVAAGGMGFFANGSFRCTRLNMSVGNSVVANNAGFFPVQATRVGGNDQLDVVYAQDVSAGAWTVLKEVSNGSSATLSSAMLVTVAQQPAVLLARKVAGLGSPCLVRTVTASDPATVGAKQSLTFGVAGTHNQGVFAVTPDFEEHDPVVLLGNVNWNRYEVQGTNLVITRRMNNTTATVLPNVIAFRVQYGVTNASTAVEDWHNADAGGWTPINELNAPRVRAVRIGVVVRSPQREKEDPADNKCKAVPDEQTKVVLFKDTPTPVDITPPGADWKCYRYRTVELVAPLRNLVSGTSGFAWPSTTQVAP